jgi:CNT family concentrative nucleoside transporter
MLMLQSAFGTLALCAIAFALSENRSAVNWRQALTGLAATVILAAILLKIDPVRAAIALANVPVEAIGAATRAGTSFVFGFIGGGAAPFEVKDPGANFSLAFQALPLVIVVSVLTTLLFYWGILQPVVRAFGFALQRVMGVGGAVGLSTAANIFLGMVEAPLFIKPYLARLTRSELFVVMTGGMAGIAGTVLVLYATFVGPLVPGAAGHFIIASVLGAPAAIVIARLMVPETETGDTQGRLVQPEPVARSTMDAIVKGTEAGLSLFLNIVAMLIVLIALVWMANALLGLLPAILGEKLTLQLLLGYVMAPVCWLMGIPWAQAVPAGSLMGVKTVLNEFVAYLQLAQLPAGTLDPRSQLIMLYALCGFANFGSLGILIAGLTTIAPERRDDILALGGRTLVSGTLATCLMGAVVGMLTP